MLKVLFFIYFSDITIFLSLKKYVLIFKAWLCFLYFFKNRTNNVTKFLPVSIKEPKILRRSFSTSCIKNNKLSFEEELKTSHLLYIKELYRDREAPVIPFDRDLILATCYNFLDSKVKTEFKKKNEDLKVVKSKP